LPTPRSESFHRIEQEDGALGLFHRHAPPSTSAWSRHVLQLGTLLATLALTFLGLLVVTFLIGRVVPVDPVLAAVGDRASADVYEQVKIEMGLHLPLWQQFVIYLGNVLTGDFGKSVLTAQPVLADIRRVFPATLELATIATLIGLIIGIPAGVAAAVHQGRWPDQLVRFLGLIGYSMPIFWLGLLGLLLFYARLDWAPGPGRVRLWSGPREWPAHRQWSKTSVVSAG
jgi:peptide/nickel transport system permease protein